MKPLHFRLLLAAIILSLAALTFWIRLIPAQAFLMGDQFVLPQEPDVAYNLRLVEQMVRDFPAYPSVDLMTYYPYSTPVFWGPLFTTVIAIGCILTGATTQAQMVAVAYLVPPVLAATMVPLMYLLGKQLQDRVTGLIAALFTSVIAGQFVFRSFYGLADHHIAEVLFSTLFVLVFLYSLRSLGTDTRRNNVLAIFTGIAYALGLLVMPTMILFALIAGLFFLIQMVYNHVTRQGNDTLAWFAILFSLTVAGILLLYGLPSEGLSFLWLARANFVSYFGLAAIIAIYWQAMKRIRTLPRPRQVMVLGGLTLLLTAAVFSIPSVGSMISSGLGQFLGIYSYTLTVQELRSWDPLSAWSTFSWGLPLFVAGFVVLFYGYVQKHRQDYLYVFLWGLLLFVATMQHVKYEYYLAPPIALIAALPVGWMVRKAWPDLWIFLHSRVGEHAYHTPRLLGLTVAVLFSAFFVYASLGYDLTIAGLMPDNVMHPDWTEALTWLGNHSPDPGVDYYAESGSGGLWYPDESYGVMSWWDYGHWITFFSHRMPASNPFQQGIRDGKGIGAADFFTTDDEEKAVQICEYLKVRYIITDIEMDTGKFWAMATWANETEADRPFHADFALTNPENPATTGTLNFFTQRYFNSMVSRLHNFDGSMTDPDIVAYVEYQPQANGLPLITRGGQMSYAEATSQMAGKSSYANAVILGVNQFQPAARVPALRHFRLIYESSTNAVTGGKNIKYVKIFQFVEGAHIQGEGIIETTVSLSSGRSFVYRQQSENGEFVVPYVGAYRLNGEEILVTEDDVE